MLEQATGEMRSFMCHLIRIAPSVPSIKAFSAELRIRPSTMGSRFFRARLPSPKQYLAETRLLYAAAVFETPRVTVAQTAHRLNYSSPQSFGRHVREQLGVSAREFRDQYSFAEMASHFTGRLVLRHRDTLRWFEPFGTQVPIAENQISDSG
jgi:AraC-like DNA-binding protein